MKKEPDDRNKLKIASFRTTDGDWFDFSQAAESNGLTATDVLKACMVEYLQGTYKPVVNTPVSMRLQAAQGITADEAQALISTAISTAQGNDDLRTEVSHLQELMKGLATHEYVEMALKPLVVAIDTQASDLAAVKADCDLTTEGIQRLISDALSKVSIGQKTTATKQPEAPPTPKNPGETSHDVLMAVKRLKNNPQLLKNVAEGVGQGLAGKALGQHLADSGFAKGNGKPFDSATLSRFKAAVEHLNSLGEGGSIDG
jgi:hypothetical protein